MNRKLQTSVLINAVLATAVIVAFRSVIDQRKTIADFRAQTNASESASLPDTATGGTANEAPPSDQSFEPTMAPVVPTVPARAPDEPLISSAEFDTLRKHNEDLALQLREVEAQLGEPRRLVPEPDDRAAAYVGPGTWINADVRTSGLTKLIISELPPDGHVPRMTIAAWGSCLPADCEWGEVPFFLLDFPSTEPIYRRGLAVWEKNNWNRYLIVTFEKIGLKVECISIAKQRFVSHRRRIENFTRIN